MTGLKLFKTYGKVLTCLFFCKNVRNPFDCFLKGDDDIVKIQQRRDKNEQEIKGDSAGTHGFGEDIPYQ